MLADNPFASGPTSTSSAADISPLDTPFKYSHGSAASSDRVFLTYGGTSAERKLTGSPSRDRTLGTSTFTGPMPVWISRAG